MKDPVLLQAGDLLVVCFEKPQLESVLDRVSAEMQAAMPGVRLAFVEGVSGLAVFRPGSGGQSVGEVSS